MGTEYCEAALTQRRHFSTKEEQLVTLALEQWRAKHGLNADVYPHECQPEVWQDFFSIIQELRS